MLLALETATNVCSVVVQNKDGQLYERRTENKGSHSEKLFLFIEELMEELKFGVDDLSGVLVSEGPGSYTGLRISASAVKGLLFQSEVPLYAVNTLAALAVAAFDKDPTLEKVHSIIDARRVHVYHQQFSNYSGMFEPDTEVEVMPIKKFESLIESGHGITGTGFSRLNDRLLEQAEVFESEYISARSLIQLSERDNSHYFVRKVNPGSYDPKYYSNIQAD